MNFKLHNFFRSGTSHRLRIALNLKGLPYDYIPVNLRTEEHLGAKYRTVHPQGMVPALVDDGHTLIQSPAIIEWLEEKYPTPPLLPKDIQERATVRALAAIVGCDIHPINNRRILEYLRKNLGCSDAAVETWCGTWIRDGFDALEGLLRKESGRGSFCYGETPGLADVYLIPQVESARRFNVDLSPYPRILEIDAACGQLDAFINAAPDKQPDVPV